MPETKNLPTSTWVNPRWNSLRGPDAEVLRAIFQDLSNFLRKPKFYNGIDIGDETPPTRDPDTGVVTQPPMRSVDSITIDQPSAETLAELDRLDQEVLNMDATMQSLDTQLQGLDAELATAQVAITALETDPIAFTRITNVQIDTPHLVANAVTASKIAAGAVTTDKIFANTILANNIAAGAIITEKLAADAVTAAKLAALYISVGKFIRSSNYVAGSSGWAIDGDGDAELNNAVIRGTLHSPVIVGDLRPSVGSARIQMAGDQVNIQGVLGIELQGDVGVAGFLDAGSAEFSGAVTFGSSVTFTAGALSYGPNDSGGVGWRVLRVPNG